MKEMSVAAGEPIHAAIRHLVAEAPAFCIFNGIRLVAEVGATYDSVGEQYDVECRKRVKEQEEREAAEQKKRAANWIWAIRKNERARVLASLREHAGYNLSLVMIASIIEKAPVTEDDASCDARASIVRFLRSPKDQGPWLDSPATVAELVPWLANLIEKEVDA